MKLNGHLNLMGAVTWKTPGFETNDMGYLREADQILAVVWAGYNMGAKMDLQKIQPEPGCLYYK
jgi:hypothetical protein